MTDTFHEDKLKAARIYIAELIDNLDAAKFELARVRNATLEEAAKVAESEIQNAPWLKGIGAVHDGACITIAAAIRALAPSGEGEGK